MSLAKLLCTAKREDFVSGKAKSAGILAMYFEHFQRSPARKIPFCGCRFPNLHALPGVLFYALTQMRRKTIIDKIEQV